MLGFGPPHGCFRTELRLLALRPAPRCRMAASDADADQQPCNENSCCVTVVNSAAQLTRIISDDGETVLRVDRRGRCRSSAQLVVLSVTHKNSLASGLVRPIVEETCARHKYAVKFIEMRTDSFPEAPAIARSLGVRRLPYFVLFKAGQRVDHVNGMEARKHLEQYVTDNL